MVALHHTKWRFSTLLCIGVLTIQALASTSSAAAIAFNSSPSVPAMQLVKRSPQPQSQQQQSDNSNSNNNSNNNNDASGSGSGSNGDTAPAKPANPFGFQLKYELAWLDREKQTFGATLSVITLPSYDPARNWSLVINWDDSVRTNVTAHFGKFIVGYYDSMTRAAFAAPSDNLTATEVAAIRKAPYRFNADVSGGKPFTGLSDDMVLTLTSPQLISVVAAQRPGQDNQEIPLVAGQDYSVIALSKTLPTLPPTEFQPGRNSKSNNGNDSSGDGASSNDSDDINSDPSLRSPVPPPPGHENDPNYSLNANAAGTQLISYIGLIVYALVFAVVFGVHFASLLSRYRSKRSTTASMKIARAAGLLIGGHPSTPGSGQGTGAGENGALGGLARKLTRRKTTSNSQSKPAQQPQQPQSQQQQQQQQQQQRSSPPQLKITADVIAAPMEDIINGSNEMIATGEEVELSRSATLAGHVVRVPPTPTYLNVTFAADQVNAGGGAGAARSLSNHSIASHNISTFQKTSPSLRQMHQNTIELNVYHHSR